MATFMYYCRNFSTLNHLHSHLAAVMSYSSHSGRRKGKREGKPRLMDINGKCGHKAELLPDLLYRAKLHDDAKGQNLPTISNYFDLYRRCKNLGSLCCPRHTFPHSLAWGMETCLHKNKSHFFSLLLRAIS